MRRIFVYLTLIVSLSGCAGAEAPATPPAALETEEQKTLYALGFALARPLGGVEFTESELALIEKGLVDAVLKRDAQVDMQVFGPKLNAMMQERAAAGATKEKEAGRAFVEEMAKTEGATRTASGAVYIETQAGTGAQPAATDTVTVHYRGTLRDGTVFDSSIDKGTPMTRPLNAVVPCFGEGVAMMKVGGKAKLVCPADTAYGDRGSPPAIQPGATLVFEVELISVAGSQ